MRKKNTTLYRTWRPRTFDEIIGQKEIVRVLQNEILYDKIHHAYLFCGPRGTGKTSCARILARSLNCQEGPAVQPCGKCHSCASIESGVNLDVIEIDAASNRGVDNIRELREKVHLTPVECRYKVYIIDEVHMLTGEAFNALLKTLEEPPSHTIFIMATTEAHKLPKTIVSRCQKFDFHRISSHDIAEKLQMEAKAEGIHIDFKALQKIAESSDGAMRDAESILDQLSVLTSTEEAIHESDVLALLGKSNTETLYNMVESLFIGDFSSLLDALQGLVSSGTDIFLFTQDLLSYCRDIVVLAETFGKSTFLTTIPHSDNDLYFEQAKKIPLSLLMKLTLLLSNALPTMKYLSRPVLLLETTLLQMKFVIDHPTKKKVSAGHIGQRSINNSTPKNDSSTIQKTLSSQPNAPGAFASSSPTPKIPLQQDITIEQPPEIKDPLWKEFTQILKTDSPDLFIHVMRTQLVKINEETAYIVFALDNKFSYQQLNKEKNVQELNHRFQEKYPNMPLQLIPKLGFNHEKATLDFKKEEEKEEIIKDPVIIDTLKTFKTSIDTVEKTNKEL
jgi:DNA polymerase III subunit gamma/tau